MCVTKYSHWGSWESLNQVTYPVPLSAYTAQEAPYVYTQAAEDWSRELGLEPRKAGTIAMLGGRPLDGPFAQDWVERGFVVRRGDTYVD